MSVWIVVVHSPRGCEGIPTQSAKLPTAQLSWPSYSHDSSLRLPLSCTCSSNPITGCQPGHLSFSFPLVEGESELWVEKVELD